MRSLGRLNDTKEKASHRCEAFRILAPRPGLEPGTHGLTVHCSTN